MFVLGLNNDGIVNNTKHWAFYGGGYFFSNSIEFD